MYYTIPLTLLKRINGPHSLLRYPEQEVEREPLQCPNLPTLADLRIKAKSKAKPRCFLLAWPSGALLHMESLKDMEDEMETECVYVNIHMCFWILGYSRVHSLQSLDFFYCSLQALPQQHGAC